MIFSDFNVCTQITAYPFVLANFFPNSAPFLEAHFKLFYCVT